MKKYIFEKGISIPLCVIIDNNYVDYLTGQIIDNENVLAFIKSGLKHNSMEVKKVDFVVYQIVSSTNNVKDRQLIGYSYQINGFNNYLDTDRQPLISLHSRIIINKLMSGEYKQILIWE